MVRYVDLALSTMQTRSNQHAAVFTCIAQALSEQINAAAEKVAGAGPSPAGLVMEQEALLLERYSLDTSLACMTLHNDIQLSPDKRPAVGRFLTTVANNLRAGRKYHFLLVGPQTDWKEMVTSFIGLLQQYCRDAKAPMEHCRFRISKMPTVAECTFYRLDPDALHAEQPILLERIRGSLSEDGWIGTVAPPSEEVRADALMDIFHLRYARRAWERLWRAANPL